MLGARGDNQKKGLGELDLHYMFEEADGYLEESGFNRNLEEFRLNFIDLMDKGPMWQASLGKLQTGDFEGLIESNEFMDLVREFAEPVKLSVVKPFWFLMDKTYERL